MTSQNTFRTNWREPTMIGILATGGAALAVILAVAVVYIGNADVLALGIVGLMAAATVYGVVELVRCVRALGQLQRRVQRQRALQPGQCIFDHFPQGQVAPADEIEEIGTGETVSMEEHPAPHDVEKRVGEVPAGYQLVRGLLESVGAARQSFQAGGAGRDILFGGDEDGYLAVAVGGSEAKSDSLGYMALDMEATGGDPPFAGDTEQFGDGGVSIGTITQGFTSDGTFTTRKRMVQ